MRPQIIVKNLGVHSFACVLGINIRSPADWWELVDVWEKLAGLSFSITSRKKIVENLGTVTIFPRIA